MYTKTDFTLTNVQRHRFQAVVLTHPNVSNKIMAATNVLNIVSENYVSPLTLQPVISAQNGGLENVTNSARMAKKNVPMVIKKRNAKEDFTKDSTRPLSSSHSSLTKYINYFIVIF